MHELSVALHVLDIAAEESQRRGGAAVHVIHLRLGPLAGVAKEALVSAFALARASSPFPGSVLRIEDAPLAAYCPRCAAERPVESLQRMCCTRCGRPAGELSSGTQLEVTALEIEDLRPDEPAS